MHLPPIYTYCLETVLPFFLNLFVPLLGPGNHAVDIFFLFSRPLCAVLCCLLSALGTAPSVSASQIESRWCLQLLDPPTHKLAQHTIVIKASISVTHIIEDAQ